MVGVWGQNEIYGRGMEETALFTAGNHLLKDDSTTTYLLMELLMKKSKDFFIHVLKELKNNCSDIEFYIA